MNGGGPLNVIGGRQSVSPVDWAAGRLAEAHWLTAEGSKESDCAEQ